MISDAGAANISSFRHSYYRNSDTYSKLQLSEMHSKKSVGEFQSVIVSSPCCAKHPSHAAGGDFRSSLEKQRLRREGLRLSIFCHDWSLSRSFAPLRGAAAKPGYAWDRTVTQKVNSQNHSFSDPEAEELKSKADHKPVVWPDVHEHSVAEVL